MKDDKIKLWFEDGIVYYSLHGDLTLETLLKSETELVALFKQHATKPAPMIVIASGISIDNFRLRLPDFSKMLTTLNVIHLISGVWIVEANNALRGKSEALARMFLGKHLRYVESLGIAKAEAKQLGNTGLSMLETDE